MLFCLNCREGSSEKLKNTKDGTFLVRPTRNAKVPHHVYTVDIKYVRPQKLCIFFIYNSLFTYADT